MEHVRVDEGDGVAVVTLVDAGTPQRDDGDDGR